MSEAKDRGTRTHAHSQTAQVTTNQVRDPADDRKQEEYRRAYLEQLRQRECPGCGETSLF